jgi:hypothetical protein
MFSQNDGNTARLRLGPLLRICQNDSHLLHAGGPIPINLVTGKGMHVHEPGTRLPIITEWQFATQTPIPIKCCFVIQSPIVMGLQFVIRSPITIR